MSHSCQNCRLSLSRGVDKIEGGNATLLSHPQLTGVRLNNANAIVSSKGIPFREELKALCKGVGHFLDYQLKFFRVNSLS